MSAPLERAGEQEYDAGDVELRAIADGYERENGELRAVIQRVEQELVAIEELERLTAAVEPKNILRWLRSALTPKPLDEGGK